MLFSCDIVEGGFEKSNFGCNAYKLWGMSFREIMEGFKKIRDMRCDGRNCEILGFG